MTNDELVNALKCVKLGIAPGYYNIHPEFWKQLGPRGYDWLADFFTRVCHESQIPRIWRQAKVIALEKPGKDPKLAFSYRPISLLSVCLKLLDRVALQRVSPTVEKLLSSEQAGFRRSRCIMRPGRSADDTHRKRLSAEAQDRNRFPQPYCCL